MNRRRLQILHDLDTAAMKKIFGSFRPGKRDDGTQATAEETMLAAMHKSRLFLHKEFTVEEREQSRQWLVTNGYKPNISGVNL